MAFVLPHLMQQETQQHLKGVLTTLHKNLSLTGASRLHQLGGNTGNIGTSQNGTGNAISQIPNAGNPIGLIT